MVAGGDGTQDLVAWWCTDTNGGECEVIRYHLGPEGVRRRIVLNVLITGLAVIVTYLLGLLTNRLLGVSL